uniref:Uncharacterized protein n=1 Tax=Arion vulgaris TaxID=1028688 RepID=A0A0B7BFE2_9EUPU
MEDNLLATPFISANSSSLATGTSTIAVSLNSGTYTRSKAVPVKEGIPKSWTSNW